MFCHDSQSEFQIFVNREISDAKRRDLRKFESEFFKSFKQTKHIERLTTHSLTLALGSQTYRLTDYSQSLRLLTEMHTIQFSVEFNLRDLMKDPEMKKALQEREQNFLKNMAWLDEDLDRRIREDEEEKRRYEDNLAWLDEDLNEKMDERKRGLIQEIQSTSTMTETQSQRTPKIWHCGHGVPWHFSGERAANRATIAKAHHEKGIQEKYCVIGHNDDQLQKKGNNTRRQYEKFHEEAKEGDIVFTHCSIKGGLTHWGVYTGEIITRPIEPHSAAGRRGNHSHIMVYAWNSLPEVLKGTGRNSTLYEVKPTFKNYQNYSIPS